MHHPPTSYNRPHAFPPASIICIWPYGRRISVSVCVCVSVFWLKKEWKLRKRNGKLCCSWFVFLLAFSCCHPYHPLPTANHFAYFCCFWCFSCFWRLIRLFFVQKNGEQKTRMRMRIRIRMRTVDRNRNQNQNTDEHCFRFRLSSWLIINAMSVRSRPKSWDINVVD